MSLYNTIDPTNPQNAQAILSTVNPVAVNYTIALSDTVVSVAPTTGNITITLPACAAGPRRLEIHKVTPYNPLPYMVTIQCAGADRISGSQPGAVSEIPVASVNLQYRGDFIVLVSDSTSIWLCAGAQLG